MTWALDDEGWPREAAQPFFTFDEGEGFPDGATVDADGALWVAMWSDSRIARIAADGARVMIENGSWGLVRASSNTPNLVVVCESSESEEELRAIFSDLDAIIRTEPEVGDYDQTF